METKVSSTKKEVIIGNGRPTVLIGERINPTGKRKLAVGIRTGDMEYVRQEALEQVKAGADIIDVNVGVLGPSLISINLNDRLMRALTSKPRASDNITSRPEECSRSPKAMTGETLKAAKWLELKEVSSASRRFIISAFAIVALVADTRFFIPKTVDSAGPFSFSYRMHHPCALKVLRRHTAHQRIEEYYLQHFHHRIG